MNTSGNHLENVYTSLFFYNLSLNFLFFFYSHHLRGTKLCVPPPIRVEKTDFFFLCAYAAVGDVEVKKSKRKKKKKNTQFKAGGGGETRRMLRLFGSMVFGTARQEP